MEVNFYGSKEYIQDSYQRILIFINTIQEISCLCLLLQVYQVRSKNSVVAILMSFWLSLINLISKETIMAFYLSSNISLYVSEEKKKKGMFGKNCLMF